MRVKDMPRNQQKAVFAQMIDANYLNRLESAEHAHARLEYLRKRHDLAETTEDKIWGVWNDGKLTHTQKMARVRQIKAEAAEKLKDYRKSEKLPTVAGQYKKEQWAKFQKEKRKLEVVPEKTPEKPAEETFFETRREYLRKLRLEEKIPAARAAVEKQKVKD